MFLVACLIHSYCFIANLILCYHPVFQTNGRHLDECMYKVCFWDKTLYDTINIQVAMEYFEKQYSSTLWTLTNFGCSQDQTVMTTFRFVERTEQVPCLLIKIPVSFHLS